MSRTARDQATVTSPSASKSKTALARAAVKSAQAGASAQAAKGGKTAPRAAARATTPVLTTPAATTPGLTKAGTGSVTKRSRASGVTAPAAAAKPKPTAKSPGAAAQASSAETQPRAITRSTASAAAATRAAKAPPKPLALSERPIEQVWREYRATPTTEVRNFLIARHLDLVAYAAERLHKRLPSEVEINDLKSAGAFGLMDAVESFDPDRGVKFETYCTQRIRGAMFDELRSMDWVPRLVRSRTAKVEKVRKSIEMETGARPTEDEVAARLNVSGDEFEKLQKDSRPISMVSLTRKCFETDSSKDVREIDVVEDGRQENPLQAVQKQDLQALITKGLSRAERLIVILYYYEEMTMKEIGATLDLSESRVSQMHSSILARLKAQMQHRENTEE
jgi:RNA polymerase sigma factor for flagellar operon FliA